MSSRLLLLVLCCLAWTAGWTGEAEASARLRFLQASPDAPALDLWVDGQRELFAFPFKKTSEWLTLADGDHVVGLRRADEPAAVLTVPLTACDGVSYTLIAQGPFASLGALLTEDAAPWVRAPTRFPTGVGVWSGVSTYTSRAAGEAGETCWKRSRQRPAPGEGAASDGFLATAGSGRIRLVSAGADPAGTAVYDSGALTFPDGGDLDLAVVDSVWAGEGGGPASLIVMTGSQYYYPYYELPSPRGSFRAAHAALGTPHFEVRVDELSMVTRLGFDRATPYFNIGPGNRFFDFRRYEDKRSFMRLERTLAAGAARSSSTASVRGDEAGP